jgi:hypothetical protein
MENKLSEVKIARLDTETCLACREPVDLARDCWMFISQQSTDGRPITPVAVFAMHVACGDLALNARVLIIIITVAACGQVTETPAPPAAPDRATEHLSPPRDGGAAELAPPPAIDAGAPEAPGASPEAAGGAMDAGHASEATAPRTPLCDKDQMYTVERYCNPTCGLCLQAGPTYANTCFLPNGLWCVSFCDDCSRAPP